MTGEALIPAEVVPLFEPVAALTTTLTGAIIPPSCEMGWRNAKSNGMASDTLGTGQYHPLDLAVLLYRYIDAGGEAGSQRPNTCADANIH